SVLLLLPSSWFIATEVNMPGLVGENLRSALHLQSSVLLPGHESPLTFAVNSTPAQADSPHVVLWTDESRLNALFTAFEAVDLFLAGVMPRAIAACDPGEQGDCTTQDKDADTLSCASFRAGLLTRFLQIPVSDLVD